MMKARISFLIALADVTLRLAQAQEPARNVFLFDADPFVAGRASVVASLSAPDWSSNPGPLPGPVQVTVERFDAAVGLVAPAVVSLGPAPAAASYILVNQVAPDISFSSVTGIAPVAYTDQDGNGLPDEWELRYFGRTGVDPNGDEDGDGISNREEFEAGTHPNQGRPLGIRAEVVPPDVAGGLARLRFEIPGDAAEITLETVQTLGGAWTTAEGVLRQDGSRWFMEVPLDSSVPAQFFRFRRTP